MSLKGEQDAYQTALEACRTHPDAPELWEVLQEAKDKLEVAWLEHAASIPTAVQPER